MRNGLYILCGFFLTPGLCWATSYGPPVRHDVLSPNRQFVLDVNPHTNIHTVYREADRHTPLWSFSSSVWLGPVYLSNDGTVAATMSWRFVSPEDIDSGRACLQFWNKDGNFKSCSFLELAPSPRRKGWFEIGPINSSLRVWYEMTEQAEDSLRVSTTDLYEYTFSMEDGRILTQTLLIVNLLRKPWAWGLILVLVVGLILLRRVRKRKFLAPADMAMQEGR